MKAELTQELKERFFAQYFWQNIMWFDGDEEEMGVFIVSQHAKGESIEHAYLALRPLDQITDEEAIEVSKASLGASVSLGITGVRRFNHPSGPKMSTITVLFDREELEVLINLGSGYLSISSGSRKYGIFDPFHYVQKLLSFGIALPFCGHSVEDLVSAGWIKLTNPPA